MLEMLPTPWGLVRSGVAPDHPKIKSISKQFEKTAEDPRFRFFGNVAVGEHVSAAELAEQYDAVIYAIGAQSDRPLNIPGEELPGSVAAVDFVGWYNAHPHFEAISPDLSGARAVVIGNGNVALDVARILVTDPDVLARPTSPTTRWSHCAPAAWRKWSILGRRGPLQTAFTTLELRELADLEDVDVVVDPADFEGITDEDAAAVGKVCKQNIKVLRELRRPRAPAGTPPDRVPLPDLPHRDHGQRNASRRSCSAATSWSATTTGGWWPRTPAPARSCRPSWWSAPSATAASPRRGCHSTRRAEPSRTPTGRVDGSRNEYVVGWIKRGPSGVIGTNKKDSQDTVDTLIADLTAPGSTLADFGADHADELADWLASRQPKLVTDAHWKLIDEHERSAGEPHGRPRVKLPNVAKLLHISHG